jgi:hypothetical protein
MFKDRNTKLGLKYFYKMTMGTSHNLAKVCDGTGVPNRRERGESLAMEGGQL